VTAVEKSDGATYLRSRARWAKVARISDKWVAALGFYGDVKASRVDNAATKRHAMTIAKVWIEDGQ
jgi:hypothetical protein